MISPDIHIRVYAHDTGGAQALEPVVRQLLLRDGYILDIHSHGPAAAVLAPTHQASHKMPDLLLMSTNADPTEAIGHTIRLPRTTPVMVIEDYPGSAGAYFKLLAEQDPRRRYSVCVASNARWQQLRQRSNAIGVHLTGNPAFDALADPVECKRLRESTRKQWGVQDAARVLMIATGVEYPAAELRDMLQRVQEWPENTAIVAYGHPRDPTSPVGHQALFENPSIQLLDPRRVPSTVAAIACDLLLAVPTTTLQLRALVAAEGPQTANACLTSVERPFLDPANASVPMLQLDTPDNRATSARAIVRLLNMPHRAQSTVHAVYTTNIATQNCLNVIDLTLRVKNID